MTEQHLQGRKSQICSHCGLAEIPCGTPRGGPNGVTQAAIDRGVEVMARIDPDRTAQQHEFYVRSVVQGIREHLVQRHLYDAIVRQYNPPQNNREPRSGGSAAGVGISQLHDKPDPALESTR